MLFSEWYVEVQGIVLSFTEMRELLLRIVSPFYKLSYNWHL